jgi:hypothetical protein
MSDKLVFDLAQEVEGSPNVFVRKDWLNILDNQNQNYNNNQSIIDTSQLSNSNKYMSYREAYFSIPFLVTLGSVTPGSATFATNISKLFTPATGTTSADYAVGLKNWFGQIIHSFTLDYNGTTIVQQTPYVNMWNSFKLMTSLSLDDINTQGATIGFFPDTSDSWGYTLPPTAPTTSFFYGGTGVCNNTNLDTVTSVSGAYSRYNCNGGNVGLIRRQQLINFDLEGGSTTGAVGTASTETYGSLISGGLGAPLGAAGSMNLLWKSYITKKQNQVYASPNITSQGYIQYSIVATVYLKHIHSFFNMCPLLKGVFMKMTMNLNNVSTSFSAIATASGIGAISGAGLALTAVSSPLGGVNPLMVASGATVNSSGNGSTSIFPVVGDALAAGDWRQDFRMNISVGATCLDQQLTSSITSLAGGSMSKSVYLYVPAYTFNPVFEQAYLSSPVKQIKYTDIYQYQVLNVAAGANFNNLLTNGIANVKSVLILPFYSSTGITTIGGSNGPTVAGAVQSFNTGILTGTPVFQSPFDPAGTGPTSPLCWLTNFNVQVSGQNAIYNVEKYNFEQFNNQLYGCNAVNGGLTDGITSGQIDRQAFDMEYCYYYVNIERMLPVEMSVPKSIQILGQNLSSRALDLYCFIEYGNEISIDALTGARV